MLLFKYFKNQKEKKSVNDSNVEVAEDALVVQDSKDKVCLTSTSLNVTSVAKRERRHVSMRLVQGASDSKVKNTPTTQKVLKTKQSGLYPNLEGDIPTSTQRWPEEKQKIEFVKVISEDFRRSAIKLDKTIHDVADDITCTLHAELNSDEQLNSKFKQLLTDIEKTVTLISPSVELPNYEYNFDSELDFKKQNINPIKDPEEYHENVGKNQQNSTSESSQHIIFKKYHQAFKSYKAQ